MGYPQLKLFLQDTGGIFYIIFYFRSTTRFQTVFVKQPKVTGLSCISLTWKNYLKFFGVKISSYHNHDRYFFRNARCDNSHELFFLNENVGLRRFLAVLIGYFIFNTIPSFWTVIGTIIIIMSGVYIWLRERSIKAISHSR